MIINKKLSRLEFASVVVGQLKKYNINCVLVGGSCVSIYTNEKYLSDDLDFITPNSRQSIEDSLTKIGFKKEGKYFKHNNSKYFVEFPSGPVSIGNRINIEPEEIKIINGIDIHMLSPTQSVMDRLSAWYYWQDRRSLLQAVEIFKQNIIDLDVIYKWSKEEGQLEGYNIFLDILNQLKKS